MAAATALVALVAGCGGQNSWPAASVSGTVLSDQSLQPVAGAQVSLGEETSTTTGATGAFSFPDVPTGDGAVLEVTASGFQPVSRTISIRSGGNALGVTYLPPVLPAGTAWITGRISFNGAPVVGGTVITATQSAVTKADGTYALYGEPAPANVQLAASDSAGHAAQTVVSVQSGQLTSGVDMSLTVYPGPGSPPPAP
jgi:hypothetical protein